MLSLYSSAIEYNLITIYLWILFYVFRHPNVRSEKAQRIRKKDPTIKPSHESKDERILISILGNK